MSRVHIPPALDRHLVSTARTAVIAGDFAVGAFEAAVEEVIRVLCAQGATHQVVERALADVIAGIASPYERTPAAERYAALETRAIALVVKIRERGATD